MASLGHNEFWQPLRFEAYKADSRLAPSQWETSLQSNAVSHWLGANLDSALACKDCWCCPSTYKIPDTLTPHFCEVVACISNFPVFLADNIGGSSPRCIPFVGPTNSLTHWPLGDMNEFLQSMWFLKVNWFSAWWLRYTHLSRDKMAAISQTTFQMHFS